MRFECVRCGAFALSGSAEAALPNLLGEAPARRAVMSHTLRRAEAPQGSSIHIITSDELPSYWARGRLPSTQEQANNLILWGGDSQPSPGSRARASADFLSAWIGTALGNADLGWLINELQERHLISYSESAGLLLPMLTMEGWLRYDTLKQTQSSSRTAFMAMKFGDPILNRVVEDCFKPAVARAGFELRLVTDEQPAGLIDNHLRAAILSARFVIADLTHGSHGAYWEAGFADGLGLPVIYTCESTKWGESRTHFDTNHMVTIVWGPSELGKSWKRTDCDNSRDASG